MVQGGKDSVRHGKKETWEGFRLLQKTESDFTVSGMISRYIRQDHITSHYL